MSQTKQSQNGTNGYHREQVPDPEVSAQPRRRQFSNAYKLAIIAKAENCEHGEIGALLRREGLYSSHLSKWRGQKAAGELDGRARKVKAAKRQKSQEMKRLQAENARLQRQLEKAELVIDVQKKLSKLLGLND